MNKNELLSCFKGFELPRSFLTLLDFDIEIAKQEYFSEGFEFNVDSEKIGFKSYSEDVNFLKSLIEFANADATGSTYSFWIMDESLDLSKAPIVVFGSEGGYHVVAKNFDELLQLLSIDVEPMVDWDEAIYYRDTNDYEPSGKIEEYKEWLKTVADIEITENPDVIVEQAQEMYQELFNNWIDEYYKG